MECWWCLNRKAMPSGGFCPVPFSPALLPTALARIPSSPCHPAAKWRVTSKYGSYSLEVMVFLVVFGWLLLFFNLIELHYCKWRRDFCDEMVLWYTASCFYIGKYLNGSVVQWFEVSGGGRCSWNSDFPVHSCLMVSAFILALKEVIMLISTTAL